MAEAAVPLPDWIPGAAYLIELHGGARFRGSYVAQYPHGPGPSRSEAFRLLAPIRLADGSTSGSVGEVLAVLVPTIKRALRSLP